MADTEDKYVKLPAEWHSSSVTICEHGPEITAYAWEEEFYDVVMRYSVPRIGMYRRQPCFYGGLHPRGVPAMGDDDIVIMGGQLKYIIVNQSEVHLPDDREYRAFFSEIIKSKLATVMTSDSGYCYIKIGGKYYRDWL